MYLNPASPSVARRQAIEKKIILSLIDELLAAGFGIRVFDGEELHPLTTDKKRIVADVMNTDDDTLQIYKAGVQFGWIRLVYGNDGWDVISDYTTNLESFMPTTLALVNANS